MFIIIILLCRYILHFNLLIDKKNIIILKSILCKFGIVYALWYVMQISLYKSNKANGMSNRIFRSVIIGSMLTIFCVGIANANLIVNGGFEDAAGNKLGGGNGWSY